MAPFEMKEVTIFVSLLPCWIKSRHDDNNKHNSDDINKQQQQQQQQQQYQ